MGTTHNYTPHRLFYDLRQLQSLCQSGCAHAKNSRQKDKHHFYLQLELRLREMINNGKTHIAIAGDEKKSPLHCINTHQFEFVDESLSQKFNTRHLNPYTPSQVPIAGEYTCEQMLRDTDAYINTKTALRDSLSEDMVKKIISHDITIKNTFRANVMNLEQSGEKTILVSYTTGTSRDKSVINKINAFELN